MHCRDDLPACPLFGCAAQTRRSTEAMPSPVSSLPARHLCDAVQLKDVAFAARPDAGFDRTNRTAADRLLAQVRPLPLPALSLPALAMPPCCCCC